jgi:hypothetical protein
MGKRKDKKERRDSWDETPVQTLAELIIWGVGIYIGVFLVCSLLAPDMAMKFWPINFFLANAPR